MSVELLAPAGSYEGLIRNLDCGADAVYVGGKSFGARAYAQNLSDDELCTAIDEAHVRDKKLYLTVNTLLKNEELYGSLYSYLAPLYEQGLDAVIVQDFGVMNFIMREFPSLAVHASTQMTVTGPRASAWLWNHGVSRVVPARELNLQEIREIRRQSDIEIEVFVHGALCYSYSGQCLFSSLLGGRSGNRGRCAQPCRLPYRVSREGQRLTSGREVCPLSPKDMNTIELLPQIIEAGVSSLKVEGRMKQSSYAAGVINIYRKYLDLYQDNPQNYRVEKSDLKELAALFSRGGSCRGYFEMRNGREMMALSNEKKTGDFSENFIKRKEKVKGILCLSSGKRAILCLEYSGKHVKAEGDVVETAKQQPLDEERIRRQLSKTGNTPYEFSSLTVQMEGDIFFPMGSLNRLRRDAFEQLSALLVKSKRRKLPQKKEIKHVSEWQKIQKPENTSVLFSASCETIEQAQELLSVEEINRLYCRWDFVEKLLKRKPEKEIYMMLPHVVRMADWSKLENLIQEAVSQGCKGFLVRSLEAYAWLSEHGYGSRCVFDSSLYTFNDESISFWRREGITALSAPLELNFKELSRRDNSGGEFLIYGYIPLMISAQCVQKNLDSCRKNGASLILTDRYHKDFRVSCQCDFCYNVIYNSIPYGLLKETKQVASLGFSRLRLSFTGESKEETRRIAEAFCRSYAGTAPALDCTLTKGHFKRGVE